MSVGNIRSKGSPTSIELGKGTSDLKVHQPVLK